MFAPGYMFSTEEDDTPSDEGFAESHLRSEYAHMRVSFSSATVCFAEIERLPMSWFDMSTLRRRKKFPRP
jgi:hypothetical protein